MVGVGGLCLVNISMSRGAMLNWQMPSATAPLSMFWISISVSYTAIDLQPQVVFGIFVTKIVDYYC